jgi:two-component system, NtrC family, response regulator PilR
VVAATNRDLETEVREGRFREDLYFRLNVVQIDLPALRQRREDIPILAMTFVEKFAKEYQRRVMTIAPEAMELLLTFSYPGNVRQLENIIERAVALAKSGEITVRELPKEVQSAETRLLRVVSQGTDASFPDEGMDLERSVEEFEARMIARALEKADGVKTKAAELLGLSFRQFRYKLAKYEK